MKHNNGVYEFILIPTLAWCKAKIHSSPFPAYFYEYKLVMAWGYWIITIYKRKTK